MSTSVSASRTTPRSKKSSSKNLWHASAPATVVVHDRWDDRSDGWLAWAGHLQDREQATLAELFGDAAALNWGAPADAPTNELLARLGRVRKGRREAAGIQQTLTDWLSDTNGRLHDARYADECLAWAYHLPRLAALVPATLWWRVLEHLTAAVHAAAAANPEHNPLPQQLLGAELGLVLAERLPEIEACRGLAATGVRGLLEGFDKLLGKDDFPHARHLALVRPLLACWTRARLLAARLDDLPWPEELDGQNDRFLLNALRLRRRDGSQALTAGKSRDMQLFEAAIAAAHDPTVCQAAASLAAVKPPATKRRNPPLVLPPTGYQSDRAEFGVLRSGWSREAILLTAAYSDLTVNCELHVAGETVWSGPWSLDVRVDGEPRQIDSPWENVCWVSDDDVDYLELQAQLRGGLRVQRLMLVARKQRFVLLADAVLGREAGNIDYRGTLPLGGSAECMPAETTREVSIAQGRLRARALPLGLPEWRQDRRGGSLTAHADGLELTQSRHGVRLLAPLWIDLEPRRARQPLTWRSLTVAEDRKVQPADVAVGYRVQIGRDQWLIYRSLGPRANRTLLGSNLVSEFMLARFPSTGEADPLLEVE